MATPVSENEPISQTEDGVDFSFNASESELGKQPSESEAPRYNTDETKVEEDPVYDNVAQTTGEEPAENSIATSVSEGPVSNDVVAIDGEAPVSNSNDSQLAQENLVDNCEDDISIVKVDEGSFDNSVAVMEEGSFNNSDAVMEEGSFVSNSIVPAMEEGLSVSNSIVPVMEDGSSVSNSIVPATGEGSVSNSLGPVRVPPEKRTLYKFGQRTSNYRGVTRHRWTGKYEAHLWDNSTITEGRKRKGKQVYLGGYESEEKAAQAYDLAALKYWGPGANTKLNFPLSTYEKELEAMKDMSREEYVNSLRRKSICFTRGHSIYRGVTRQNEGRRWQARIGRVAGGKDIYLGTYDTEEEAAEAYDIAAVKLRGMNAITNFDISNYYKEGTKELDVIPIKTVEEESSHLKIRYFKLT